MRHQALPALEDALGPGVAEALARTASQLRADTDCLDELAFAESGQLREPAPTRPASTPTGCRAARRDPDPGAAGRGGHGGLPAGALTAGHVERIDALVTGWHGQRWVDLPGGVRAGRRDGKVWFTAARPK